jgi:hypothetical protein
VWPELIGNIGIGCGLCRQTSTRAIDVSISPNAEEKHAEEKEKSGAIRAGGELYLAGNRRPTYACSQLCVVTCLLR